MAYLTFNKNEIHLQVLVGSEEENYEQSKTIKRLSEKVKALKKERDDFLENILKPEAELIQTMVDEENKKLQGTKEEEEAVEESSS